MKLALQRLCRSQAKALGWSKPYMVLTKNAVARIEAQRPRSIAALQGVPGIGPKKLALFGEDVVTLVQRHG